MQFDFCTAYVLQPGLLNAFLGCESKLLCRSIVWWHAYSPRPYIQDKLFSVVLDLTPFSPRTLNLLFEVQKIHIFTGKLKGSSIVSLKFPWLCENYSVLFLVFWCLASVESQPQANHESRHFMWNHSHWQYCIWSLNEWFILQYIETISDLWFWDARHFKHGNYLIL